MNRSLSLVFEDCRLRKVGDENSEADERGANWEDDVSEEDRSWQLTRRVGNVDDLQPFPIWRK